jgi:hypothetical protein
VVDCRLLVRLPLNDADGCCCWLLCVSTRAAFCTENFIYRHLKSYAKENIGQYKSKDQDFKSYANAVFRHGCCCMSVSLSTETLREIKENMGQSKSKERDFKE